MFPNVLVAGCGYVGCALGAGLKARGNRVWGLCRSETSLDRVRAAGLEPLRADLNDPATLRNLPPVDAVVACQAPGRGGSYASCYLDGTSELIRALKPATHVRFVFVSSTAVYGPRSGRWVEADTPIELKALSDDAKILRRTEQTVMAAAMKGMVVRLSGIYGPDRNRLSAIKSAQFTPPMSGAWTNRIHRDDAARAIESVLGSGKAGETYLASDDAPSTQNEFYGWIYLKLGLTAPTVADPSVFEKEIFDSKRCSNAKLKALGWAPVYPSYREGYGELIR